jgi:hypothetical protein
MFLENPIGLIYGWPADLTRKKGISNQPGKNQTFFAEKESGHRSFNYAACSIPIISANITWDWAIQAFRCWLIALG